MPRASFLSHDRRLPPQVRALYLDRGRRGNLIAVARAGGGGNHRRTPRLALSRARRLARRLAWRLCLPDECALSRRRAVSRPATLAVKPVVALDARITRRYSVGMRRYVRELARRIPRAAPDLKIVVIANTPLETDAEIVGVGGANFGITEEVVVPLTARALKASLMHHFSIYAPYEPGVPFLLTIHDLIHLEFPEQFKPTILAYYRLFTRRHVARAQRIVTDDEATVEVLERFLGAHRERVAVIPLAVDDAMLELAEHPQPGETELLQSLGVEGRPYLLYAGNHRAHKNLATLFEAWRGLSCDLVLTGGDDFPGGLGQYAHGGRRVIAVGDVDRPVLAAIYRRARAYVHPALVEGFGLPMVEAMAFGVPVVASERSVPEPLRAAALAFPALDAQALRRQAERALHDDALRDDLRTRGMAVARQLTWDRTAGATAALYRTVLEELSRR
ncbi:glycosyltransferase family 1 protein [bacterium]|nr:MAG: glycosyltransferase family 1 protein [bacterium]